jgi:N-acetyl-beta-hexosaminidase
LEQAIARGHEVICGTNYYSYLNFPVTPWKGYKESRTFDISDTYNKNPSNLSSSKPLVLGMSAALWGDNNVTESMIDQRVFPRIFALSEQMWHKGGLMPFASFYKIVQDKKSGFEKLGYEFGPGLRSEVPDGYKWD